MNLHVVSFCGKWYWWDKTEDGRLSLKRAVWLDNVN